MNQRLTGYFYRLCVFFIIEGSYGKQHKQNRENFYIWNMLQPFGFLYKKNISSFSNYERRYTFKLPCSVYANLVCFFRSKNLSFQ